MAKLARPAPEPARIELELHPKQGIAFTSPATEVLYGGAAGGGKSYLMRAAALAWATAIPGLQIYLFRRKHPELAKNHLEGPKGFRALLAPWAANGAAELVDKQIRFAHGSRIHLCHCQHEKDRFDFQGAEIHVLLVDELTHFTQTIYRFLRGRVRAVGLPPAPPGFGNFPRILCGSNPGNVGHHWVKAAFVDGARPLELRRTPESEGGMLRQFVPALLGDNPSMARDDPGYRARLRGLGSAALVRAMEDGDWNVVEGAFFDCWSTARHVLRPFAVPDWWTRFRSFDWGSASPFSVGWWAVAGEDFAHPDGGVVVPRGALVRTREWYGARGPNIGLKLSNGQIADGILSREAGERISHGVADPAIFRTDGGPSIAEQMVRRGVRWRRADNRRVPGSGPVSGWDQVRQRLIGDESGRPMLFCFATCTDSIRTVPALQHDEANPEDVDTASEDHAADEWRYACMSRPWARPRPAPPPDTARGPTFGELIDRQRRKREERDG